MIPENQGHRGGSGIVSEKSILSYYKNESLRALRVENTPETG
jgi:hypothetical protein